MTPEARRETLRWGLSGAVALAAHAAVAAYILSHENPVPDAPPTAIVIDLAPVAAAPEVPETDLPPEPEQPDAEEVLEPEPPPEPEPVEEPPPVPEPEVPLPPPVQKEPETKVEPEPVKREPPKKKQNRPSVASAPRPMPAPPAPAAAPALSAGERPSSAVPNWRSRVAAILERNKRYPPEAQSRGERGSAGVRFTIDRAGRLLGASLVRSSGSAALDEEALALVRRSQPFPPPPPEIRGSTVTIAVPVRFSIR